MSKSILTQVLLHKHFTYSDGKLFWKLPNAKYQKPGDLAGYLSGKYWRVRLFGDDYILHRLIYLFHHSVLPTIVDHKDRNTLNNCISNLRPASAEQNSQNSSKQLNNTTGYKGVSKQKGRLNYRAQIWHNNKRVHLGYFETAEKAYAKYCEAATTLHKEYACID